MPQVRWSLIAVLLQACVALAAVAADQPRPPQPPLTDTTLHDWRLEMQNLYELRDNEFLLEEHAEDFRSQVIAWQGSDVVLSVQVDRVTKELVVCNPLEIGGRIMLRNGQQPVVGKQQPAPGAVVLRIGDVAPLEVAKRLRGNDRLVVRGIVASSSFHPELGIELDITAARPVAVVSRAHSGSNRTVRVNHEMEAQLTPIYPLAALAAGAAGLTVVNVENDEAKVVKSAGDSLLDEAAVKALRRNGSRNMPQGEHRFRFSILQ